MTCLVRSGLKIGCKIVRSGFTVHQPAASCLFRGFAQRVPAEPGRRDARKAQFQAVDPSLVNVHHAAMAIDAQSKAMIRQLAEGMKLLEQDRYRAARTRFSEWDGDDAHEAAWIRANAVGIALLCDGRASAGETQLRSALKGCNELSDRGMGSDSYSDIAGLLNDLAAALADQSFRAETPAKCDEMHHLLKRAKFMAERAYRPNWDLKQALNCNLAAALLLNGEAAQARTLAHQAVRAADALDAVGAGCGVELTGKQRAGMACSLWVLSEIAAFEGDHAEAVQAARRCVTEMEAARGVVSADVARAQLALSRALWSDAKSRREGDEKREAGLEALAAARLAASTFQRARVRRSHLDAATAAVNILYMARDLGVDDQDLVAKSRYAIVRFSREQSDDRSEVGALETLQRAHKIAIAAGPGQSTCAAMAMPVRVPMLWTGVGLDDLLASVNKVAKIRKGADGSRTI